LDEILAAAPFIRLTMGVYTHVEMHDRTAAIGSLPGPPTGKNDAGNSREDGAAA
jgi:hypothetical protein